jgi:hypothetical protein
MPGVGETRLTARSARGAPPQGILEPRMTTPGRREHMSSAASSASIATPTSCSSGLPRTRPHSMALKPGSATARSICKGLTYDIQENCRSVR